MSSMNCKLRREFHAKHWKAAPQELPRLALKFCLDNDWQWPLSRWERKIETEALEYHRDREPLFHGGIAGLGVGDRLLPGAVTGLNPHCFNDPDWKRSRVYATPALHAAQGYADDIGGAVYRVRLGGSIGLEIMDVRVFVLISGSPQFRRLERATGERLVDLEARNDECRARGFPPDDLVPLNSWQRRLGHYFDFGMERLEQWKADRQRAQA